MPFDDRLQEISRQVPDCVAVGVVDVTTGRVLEKKIADSQPAEVVDLLAAAGGDLFQGPSMAGIETMLHPAQSLDPEQGRDGHPFREIVVLSDHLIYVFLRSKHNQDQALVIACRQSANLGMVLSKTRSALSVVESAA